MQINTSDKEFEVRHFHLFAGLGGGAKGFNKGSARVGNLKAKFRCIGGIDNDAAAMRDFAKAAGVSGTVMDLFSREQYRAFHGYEPPFGWQEATTTDIHRAAGFERPQIIFLSAPCKGFSGLLSESRSKTDKYQALNQLTLRGVWLSLEAFKDDPVELFVFENVPRIANRGRHLLDQIVALFRHYGYEVAETTHDCGELGGLAQSRKRFLLVARHREKIPNFLYEPEKRSLRAVGDILGRMPTPLSGLGGPMHRVPSLQWKTWVRLAFVEAGSDWRSLNRLRVVDGTLADYLIVPEDRNHGFMGVNRWDEPSGTIAGCSRPGNGNFSVGDPRCPDSTYYQLGVLGMDETMGTITGQPNAGQGQFSIADPRMNGETAENRHKNVFRITRFDEAAGTISGGHGPSSGGQCVADPRHQGPDKHNNCFRVVRMGDTSPAVTGGTGPSAGGLAVADPNPGWKDRYNNLAVGSWDEPSNTVIAGGKGVQGGWQSVSDPRILNREKGDAYLTGGHYGVVPWEGQTGAVSASACLDNGRWSVADHRLPDAGDKMIAVIRAEDGTWHRPFTTLELAALQSLVDPEEFLALDGLSDSAWRERIGNAVPPDAAAAIAGVMGTTLMLSATGTTFQLSAQPIWVQPVAVALTVKGPQP